MSFIVAYQQPFMTTKFSSEAFRLLLHLPACTLFGLGKGYTYGSEVSMVRIITGGNVYTVLCIIFYPTIL